MADEYQTGAFQAFAAPTLPAWQRAYYESQLLDTIRMKSIMVPYCQVKENFAALNTKQITFSEIYDMEPNWNPMSETTLWKKGQYLDSRQMTINLE